MRDDDGVPKPHLRMLSADCKLMERGKIVIYDRYGAFFPDLPGPPDMPYAMRPKR